MVALVALAALTFAGFAILLAYSSDLIMPGVKVLGVPLGGRLRSRATLLLQQEWERMTIDLQAGDSISPITPAMLGISLDLDATVRFAYRQSRKLDRIGATVTGGGRTDVPAVARVDAAVAEGTLASLSPHYYVAPRNASLRLINGRAEEVPPVIGRALDARGTAAWLAANAAQVLSDRRLSPVFSPVEPAIVDASALVSQANQWLSQPLSVRGYDPVQDEVLAWAIDSSDWVDWLLVGFNVQDPSKLRLSLKSEPLRAFLASQGATLAPERYLDLGEAEASIQAAVAAMNPDVQVRIYHHERQHVVGSGETVASIARDYGIPYPWILEANPGVGDALHVDQVLTIPSPDVLLPLPLVEDKRIVVSISHQYMWAYQDGAVQWEWVVSTGIPSSPTSPGVFQIQSHEPNAYAASWNLWMPYFMGIYRPVPTSDFMNGFHGFPTRDGSSLLWTGSLGHPVTFGCILVSTANAAYLYEWAEEGVIVEIRP